MRFPSINDVAADLRSINAETLEPADEPEGIDVRLQVLDDGAWSVHSGDASYDTDHHGFWGSSSVPGNGKRFNARDVARDLIEQCRDDEAQSR